MSISHRLLTSICIGLSLLALTLIVSETRTSAALAGTDRSQTIVASSIPNGEALPLSRSSWRVFPQEQKPKTIAETHKNIKVLGEFPDSQLIPMMNLMSASLGVRCNYCHVNKNGQWDYAADEKAEKNTAREMITMTININKLNPSVDKAVGCNTCHRGRTTPAGVIALPLPERPQRGQGGPGGPRPGGAGPQGQAGGQPGQQPGQTAPATPALPSAEDILAKYITALGGQAAIDKMKTKVSAGTYTTGNGRTASFQVDQAAPNKFHVTFTTPEATVERGFNGSAGWDKSPRGLQDLGGPQLADLKAAFGLLSDINLKEQFTRMNVRKDKIGDRDVFVITGVTTDGRRERLSFDAETGLLLRRTSAVQTPLGVIPQETNFEDYRDVAGVKVPFTIRTLAIDEGATVTRKFTDVKINAAVDESKFNKPAGN
jgi:hypothetical protein